MSIQSIYREYLEDVKLMQLATCRDNQPWLCNVWFVMDEDGKVYFISRENRRHSLEIGENEKVAGTFHKWFDEGLGQKGQALIVGGTARQLKLAECRKPFTLYAKRFPKIVSFQTLERFLRDEGSHYFYEITPTEIVWWDEVNFPDDPRQKVL